MFFIVDGRADEWTGGGTQGRTAEGQTNSHNEHNHDNRNHMLDILICSFSVHK